MARKNTIKIIRIKLQFLQCCRYLYGGQRVRSLILHFPGLLLLSVTFYKKLKGQKVERDENNPHREGFVTTTSTLRLFPLATFYGGASSTRELQGTWLGAPGMQIVNCMRSFEHQLSTARKCVCTKMRKSINNI